MPIESIAKENELNMGNFKSTSNAETAKLGSLCLKNCIDNKKSF